MLRGYLLVFLFPSAFEVFPISIFRLPVLFPIFLRFFFQRRLLDDPQQIRGLSLLEMTSRRDYFASPRPQRRITAAFFFFFIRTFLTKFF